MVRRRLVLAAIVTCLAGVSGTWALLSREPEVLPPVEQADAERLAGRWRTSARESRGDNRILHARGEVAERIFSKCQEYAELITDTKATGKDPPEEFTRREKEKQECLDSSEFISRAFAVNPNIEPVDLAGALTWWPHEILGPSSSPKGLTGTMYAVSQGWGRNGDPQSEGSGVILVYSPPITLPAVSSFQEVLDAGGWWLSVERRIPKSEKHPRDGRGKRIAVGTATGYMLEVSTTKNESRAVVDGSVNRLFTYWDLPRDDHIVRVELTVSPQLYEAKEAIEVARGLVGLRDHQKDVGVATEVSIGSTTE